MDVSIPTLPSFRGRFDVPGDKSLAHRALIFASLAEGESILANLPRGRDVLATRNALEALGVRIDETADGAVRVHGTGGRFIEPAAPIDCMNSGTTMRLLAGILAGAGTKVTLTGDASLSRRPMERVAAPLRELGADIETTGGRPPLHIVSGATRSASIELPIASAQLKSAVLLCGLFLDGTTTVSEPAQSRDHTERMFRFTGVPFSAERQNRCDRRPGARPRPFTMTVAADPSSAAFLAAIAALVPGSRAVVPAVLHNETRLGFFRALQAMGGHVRFENVGPCGSEEAGEMVAEYGRLRGTRVGGKLSLDALDELPLLATLAAFAEGETVIEDASELRVKESDRIAATAALIRAFGGDVEERDDGWRIEGGAPLRAATIDAAGDHRIALAGAVAGTVLPGTVIRGFEAAEVSFPGFLDLLEGAAS